MRADVVPSRPIPLLIKLLFSAFLAVHLFLNLRFYGPLNYLWFCDLALLTTFVSMWTNNRLLLCMTAVSLFGPSTLWMADLFYHLLTHRDWLGWTDYMQDTQLPLPLRLASTFHIWLPAVLVFCICRTRYDRRALWAQTAVAVLVLIICRTLAPPPPAHNIHEVVNINAAYGTNDAAPQTRLPPAIYLLKVMIKCWIGFYFPTHLLLNFFFGLKRKPSLNPATAERSTLADPV